MSVLSRRARTAETRRTTEQALVTATLELLGEGAAYADLGIEQIVKQAGLSRPTFYTYFRDKRALVLHLGSLLERELGAVAQPWFASDTGSARETIAAVLAVFRSHRRELRAITEAATYDPEVSGFWRAFHDRFVPGARRRILAGNPELNEEAVDARAYALIYMTERTMIEQVTGQLTTDEALVDQLAWMWEQATGTA